MSPKQRGLAAIRKHGSYRKAAKALGIGKTTLQDWIHGHTRTGKSVRNAVAPSVSGRSMTDFRAQYDKSFIVPKRIKDGLKKLGAGWEYELQFAKMCGVSMPNMGLFREMFIEHVVQLREGRRAWAGTKKLAAQMREMI